MKRQKEEEDAKQKESARKKSGKQGTEEGEEEPRSRKSSEGQERFDSGVHTQEDSEEDIRVPVPVIAADKDKVKEGKQKSDVKKESEKKEKQKDKKGKSVSRERSTVSKKSVKGVTDKDKSKPKSRETVDEPDSRKKSRDKSRVNGFEEVELEAPKDSERKSRPVTRQTPKAGTPLRSLDISPVDIRSDRTRSPTPIHRPPGRDKSVQTNSEDEFEVPDDSPDNELLALERERQRTLSRETTLPTAISDPVSPERKRRESPLRSSKVKGDGRIHPGLLRKEEPRSRTPLILNGDVDDEELSPDDQDGPLDFEFYNRRKRIELAERLAREKQRNREREDFLKLQVLLERERNKNIKLTQARSKNNLTMSDSDNYETALVRKKPVPKRVNNIQESVRRYQDQRRYVRQLHQLKRAQIYTGPMHDIVLFSKLMDVYKHSPGDSNQDLDLTVMENWDGYLRGKLFATEHLVDQRIALAC